MILSRFCSVAAAERITGRKVRKVEEWAHVVLVCFMEGSNRFFSKEDFKDDAIRERAQKAATCRVIPGENFETPDYFVLRPGAEQYHTVRLYRNNLQCDCGDFKSQWPRQPHERICLHTMAVAFHLNKSMGQFNSYKEKMNEQLTISGMSID